VEWVGVLGRKEKGREGSQLVISFCGTSLRSGGKRGVYGKEGEGRGGDTSSELIGMLSTAGGAWAVAGGAAAFLGGALLHILAMLLPFVFAAGFAAAGASLSLPTQKRSGNSAPA